MASRDRVGVGVQRAHGAPHVASGVAARSQEAQRPFIHRARSPAPYDTPSTVDDCSHGPPRRGRRFHRDLENSDTGADAQRKVVHTNVSRVLWPRWATSINAPVGDLRKIRRCALSPSCGGSSRPPLSRCAVAGTRARTPRLAGGPGPLAGRGRRKKPPRRACGRAP